MTSVDLSRIEVALVKALEAMTPPTADVLDELSDLIASTQESLDDWQPIGPRAFDVATRAAQRHLLDTLRHMRSAMSAAQGRTTYGEMLAWMSALGGRYGTQGWLHVAALRWLAWIALDTLCVLPAWPESVVHQSTAGPPDDPGATGPVVPRGPNSSGLTFAA